MLATEQYPQGLGPTVPELATRLGTIPGKVAFSCLACTEVAGQLDSEQRPKVLLAGIEAHVCIQQTALDLLTAGHRVYLAVDAIGARFPLDYEIALRRMESNGATLTTTEAALFEWCQAAGTPQFKQISALVRDRHRLKAKPIPVLPRSSSFFPYPLHPTLYPLIPSPPCRKQTRPQPSIPRSASCWAPARARATRACWRRWPSRPSDISIRTISN